MGTNPVVQGVMQPILIFGVVFHFVMGFILEAKNRSSRGLSYAKNVASDNSTWMSKKHVIKWSSDSSLLRVTFL